jgi:hypothetical protein
VSDKERNLGNDAADNRLKYSTSVEDLLNHPDGPSILQRLENAEHEVAKERGLRRQVMEDHYDTRSDEEIALGFIDREVEDAREFINSEEGEDFLRQDITRHYAQGGQVDYDPVKAYASPYFGRLRREQAQFEDSDSDEG